MLFLILCVKNLMLIFLYYNMIYLYYNLIFLCLLYFKLNPWMIICYIQKKLLLFLYLLLLVALVWLFVVVCSYDCNSNVTCSYYYDYKSNVIWVCSYCCSSDADSIWSSCISWVLRFVSTLLFLWLQMHILHNWPHVKHIIMVLESILMHISYHHTIKKRVDKPL
jgi:hypothetical protein